MGSKNLLTVAATLVALAADLTKLAAEGGDAATDSTPPATRTPALNDEPTAKKGKGASKPAPAAAPADEPETEPEAAADESEAAGDEADDQEDLPTPESIASVEDAAATTEVDEIKQQLLDYYVAAGSLKKDIATALAEMSEEELREAYKDYCARLLDLAGEYPADFETPYKAKRLYSGVETVKWCVGGHTLDDAKVKEKGLADPAEKPAEKARTKLPGRAKK